jgi:hypothetical protein
MSLITNLLKKFEVYKWTIEYQITWEEIKNWYIQAPIFISPHWARSFMFTQMHLN